MPKRSKEPHLLLRSARRDKQGRITHRPAWIIKDGNRPPVGTGCGESEHEEAKVKLHEYCVQKYAAKALNLDAEEDSPPVPAREYPIATAVMLYQHHKVAQMEARLSTKGKQPGKGVEHKQVGDLKRRLFGLLHYWGDKTVSKINRDRCRKFDTVETKDGLKKLSTSSRARHLEDLKAAVNFAMAEQKCETVPLHWDIPKHARRKRTTWYTRNQIAKLVWRAHRKRGRYVFSAKKSGEAKAGVVKETSLRPMRHIARMVLVAVGTGTRSERVEMASFYDIPGHPFIDVDAGIFWRSWEGEDVSSNKRAEPCVLHPALLAQCRRWKAMGLRWLTEYRGRPVKVSSAFYRLVREVLEDEAPGRSIHTMRHTAATWLVSSPKKLNVNVIAGFLCMDVQVLIDVYGHHSPDFQSEIRDAWKSGDVGRNRSGKAASENPVEKLLLEERRRGLFDLAEGLDAPSEAFAEIEAATAQKMDGLRARMKKAARSGDWSGFSGDATVIPIHRHQPPPFATGTTGIKGNEREPTRH